MHSKPILIITAAGRGSRLGEIGKAIPKAFIPVALGSDGFPESALSRIMRQFKDNGFVEQRIAVSPHHWFSSLSYRDCNVNVTSVPPEGEWSAVAACLKEVPEQSSVVVISGDNVFSDDDLSNFLAHSESDPARVRVAVSHREDTSQLTHVSVADGKVKQLLEKPVDSRSGLAKAGLYYLTRSALQRIDSSPPRRDRFGEQSMTEILKMLMEANIEITAHELRSGFFDIGTARGVAAVIDARLPTRHTRQL